MSSEVWTTDRYRSALAAGIIPEGTASEPEPDAAVVRGFIDDYLDHPPLATDVSSVIEVADSSLSLDLGPKLQAYALAGIPQYVVVDLVNNRVLVHEDPAASGSFARVSVLEKGEAVGLRSGEERVMPTVDHLLR